MIRILVVEDDRDISALIQLALKNAGYDVFAAFDGVERAQAAQPLHRAAADGAERAAVLKDRHLCACTARRRAGGCEDTA